MQASRVLSTVFLRNARVVLGRPSVMSHALGLAYTMRSPTLWDEALVLLKLLFKGRFSAVLYGFGFGLAVQAVKIALAAGLTLANGVLFARSPSGSDVTPTGLHANLPTGNATPLGEVVTAGDLLPPSSGVTLTRLRRRARWVRAVERVLGGRRGIVASFLRGWWRPDLPSRERSDVLNYLLGSISNGVRVLGGGFENVAEGEDPSYGVYFVVDDGESQHVLFPQLLARLRSYAVYRNRDLTLLATLRARGGEWCRKVGLRPHVVDLAITDAVAFAMLPSTHEEANLSRVQEALGVPPLSAPL